MLKAKTMKRIKEVDSDEESLFGDVSKGIGEGSNDHNETHENDDLYGDDEVGDLYEGIRQSAQYNPQ